MIASFGAIGASLALGSQFTNVGQIHGWRLAIALIACGLGFAGVIAAMWLAVRVQVGSYVSFGKLEQDTDLTRFLEVENPQYLGPYERIAALRGDYLEAFKQETDERKTLAQYVKNVTNVASYEKLRRRFARSLPWIMGSVAVAAVSATTFAWAANPSTKKKAEETSAAAALPMAVNLSLTQQGAKLLTEELGTQCDRSNVAAVAVAQTKTGGLDVVTLPTPKCNVVRFTMNPQLGVVTGSAPVCKKKLDRRRKEFVDCGGVAPG